MRIEYRRSGGIAGIDMTATVDTQELPKGQAQLAADLMNPRSAAATPPTVSGAPDTFSYELTVDDGQRTQTHHWNESETPRQPNHCSPACAGAHNPRHPADAADAADAARAHRTEQAASPATFADT